MKRILIAAGIAVLADSAFANSIRLKDLVEFDGVRSN